MAGRTRYRRRGVVALSAAAGLLLVGWVATTPLLVDHWPRVLAVGLFLFVFVLPTWFVPARSPGSLAGVTDPEVRGRLEDDRLKLQNDVRIGLLQAVAGVAVIAAVAVTWQQLETDRRQLRQELATSDATQAGDRFVRALEQLGSEQLDVRLGGIYSLERIAARATDGTAGPAEGAAGRWAARDRVQVFEILAAYVRGHSRRPPAEVGLGDVHAAVSVLGRRAVLPEDPPLDLHGSLLPGARLEQARLAGADLRGADLRVGDLRRADLRAAHLENTRLCGAQLQGADLTGAILTGASATVRTQWPAGFDWRAAGVKLVPYCA